MTTVFMEHPETKARAIYDADDDFSSIAQSFREGFRCRSQESNEVLARHVASMDLIFARAASMRSDSSTSEHPHD